MSIIFLFIKISLTNKRYRNKDFDKDIEEYVKKIANYIIFYFLYILNVIFIIYHISISL